MDKYEENLLRLNRKIRDLMTQVDTLETRNRKLQHENSVLVEDVANFRVQFTIAEEGRLECKSMLEHELARCSAQYESHQLLKKRYNDLISEFVAQNQKLKSYENDDNVNQVRRDRRVPVEFIGKLSDIGKPTAQEEKASSLEKRCSAMEKELHKAYAVIDDLEFELETIDHLENANDRLEKQIRELKAELAQCRCSGTPDSAAKLTHSASSVSSPPYDAPMYGIGSHTFESIEETKHSPNGQDEAKEYILVSSGKISHDDSKDSIYVVTGKILQPDHYDSINPTSSVEDNEQEEISTL